MKRTFDSLEEAQKAADKKNDSGITQFCPLIKGVCKNGFPYGAQYACVCWEKAKAVDNKREYNAISKSVETIKWIVSDPFCGNAMFTETEIYVNN